MVTQIPPKCDIVVIGAGIAGLTAAALLSKAGLQVVVVEAESRPGGYLAGFERKGFIFDSAIHWLNQCGPGGFVNKIFNYLDADFPKCKPLARIRRYKGDSFDYLLTNNPCELRDQFIHNFPSEAKGIGKFFADIKVLGGRMRAYNDLMRARETMSIWERGCYGLRMAHWALPILKHLRVSAEKGLNRYFKSADIKKIFCSDEYLVSIMMPICWACIGDFQAPPIGGSQAFPVWLYKVVESSGSQVLLKRRVEKVLLDDSKAVGVSLSKGNDIRSRYVLAACDVETLYEKMLPRGQIPADLCRRLRGADVYDSAVTLLIGLDCDVASLGFNEELVFLTRDDVSRRDHTCGDPHNSSLNVLAPTFRDPSLAPEGKGTLTINCPARLDYADHWKTENGLKRGNAYKAFKQEYAEILVDRVEKALAPGLKKHIEVLDIATPVTYWRYTGNRGGSIMGQRPTNKNIKNKIAHYRTPVENLLLGGHWAEYGGGVPIAVKSAVNTSLLILKEMDKTAFKELRDVVDGKVDS